MSGQDFEDDSAPTNWWDHLANALGHLVTAGKQADAEASAERSARRTGRRVRKQAMPDNTASPAFGDDGSCCTASRTKGK